MNSFDFNYLLYEINYDYEVLVKCWKNMKQEIMNYLSSRKSTSNISRSYYEIFNREISHFVTNFGNALYSLSEVKKARN
ncbi:MAG: hypothetical protein LBM99_04320 [Bacillales bacterium]|jgi:ABC-type oligopeptide transport system substrate-binding subunit|nr:hypothetical protein [Bacillales bacterium]